MSDDYYCDSILSGRVPVQVVAETENVLAFHHVFPSWETHIVVIPRSTCATSSRLRILVSSSSCFGS